MPQLRIELHLAPYTCLHCTCQFFELFHVEMPKHGWVTYAEGMKVDVLLFVEAYEQLLDNHDRLMASGNVGLLACYGDDMHYHNVETRHLKQRAFSLPVLLVLTYPYVGYWLYPEIDMAARSVWLPHSAAARFVRPLNHSASFEQVLLTGSTARMWYPYRAAAENERSVLQIKHPGYAVAHSRVAKRRFVDRMVAFGVGLTDCSTLQYALAKVFEIPASGQLLLVNAEIAPVLRALCMVEGEQFLAYRKKGVSSQIEQVRSLGARTRVNHIRENGHVQVLRWHTTARRASQLDRMMRCIAAARAGAPVSVGAIAKWARKCERWKIDPDSIPQKFLTNTIVQYLELKSQNASNPRQPSWHFMR